MSKKSLNDAEQYLLQQFLNNSVLDQFNFKELFRSVLNKFQIKYNPDGEAFKGLIVSYLKSINEAIKQYSLEIKNGMCELTGITFYCLVRQYDSGSIGTLSQLYSQSELKLFKKILSLIIESDDGIIDFNTIVYGINDDAGLKYTNKEIREITDKFIKDYWLISVGNGNRFALHSRTILELSQYLLEVYGAEIVNCKLCKEIVVVGVVCESCSTRMHRHCAKRFYKLQNDCMSCKNPLSDDQLAILRDSRTSSTQSQSQSQSRDIKNVTLLESQDSRTSSVASKKKKS